MIPQREGKIKMAVVCKTSVRKKEINADIKPLLSAVKKAEPKMLKPQRRKDSEYSRIPFVVIDRKSVV